MMNKKKLPVKIICFAVIFLLLCLPLERVLRYNWDAHWYWAPDWDDGTHAMSFTGRNAAFEAEPKDSIDIICVGTSEILQAFSPAIVYDTCGMTGYNMSMTAQSALSSYYVTKYALKHHTPKLLVCDFQSLFADADVDVNEASYRKAADTIPDLRIRFEIARDISTNSGSAKFSDWMFPLLHYHDAWSSLGKENFVPKKEYLAGYRDYRKGWDYYRPGRHEGGTVELTPELWDEEGRDKPLSEESVHYYDLLIGECKSRNVEVVAVIPPRPSSVSDIKVRRQTMEEYFRLRGVTFLNYSDYDEMQRLGMDFSTDFKDDSHMTGIGAYKFTTALTEDLQSRFHLEDHRASDSELNTAWSRTVREYREDMFETQAALYQFLEYLALYPDMPFVMGVEELSAAKDERYADLFERIGINVSKLDEDVSKLVRDRDGTIRYLSETDESDPLEKAYEERVHQLAASAETDTETAERLQRAGILFATFYPGTDEICTFTVYDSELTEDSFINDFETARVRLF